jgi:hypothetical protein
MSGFTPTQELVAVATGTLSVNVAQSVTRDPLNIRVTNVGTIALTGNLNISPTGTAIKNTLVVVKWEGNITPSAGKDLVVFGKTIPQSLLNTASSDNFFTAYCFYNGSAWNVGVSVDFGGTDFIGEDQIADDAISTGKVIALAITTAKIADLNVTTGKIADANVTTVKIADNNVTTAKILDANVTAGKIGTGAVTTAKILDANVTTVKILDANVTTAKLAAAAVTAVKLDANSNKTSRDIPLSFMTTAEVGNINFTICEACTIGEINVTVLSPAVNDTATLIYKDNGGVVLTASQTDITTGLTLGNIVSTTPSANNVFAAGDNFRIEMSKTTKTSCKVLVSICMTKV